MKGLGKWGKIRRKDVLISDMTGGGELEKKVAGSYIYIYIKDVL